MDNLQETLNGALKDMTPLLAAGGKKVEIVSASAEKVVVRLAGFCGGGCGCSESYQDGVRDLVLQHAPAAAVEFVN